jgi:ribonucleoside-triphosphate reductase
MVMAAQGYNMVRLTDQQLQAKLDFIENYCNASNAADGSTFDPNSNVIAKNVATLQAELNKDYNIQVKRALVYREIKKLFGNDIADKYIEQLESHEIYTHDETTIAPYCAAVSMYPFLLNGLQDFEGGSKAPKHLSSFNGGFINLVFALTSQFCGAVATVEYLMCFDYFARKDYGDDYLNTHTHIIEQELQQTVFAINQPASARNFQSAFWNISIFDRFYFEALFEHFRFPDGTAPEWESLNKLQKFFMKWFNKEREKDLLTFPVVTVSLLNTGTSIVDEEYKEFVTNELSEGNSFFIYTSKTVDSLSSCCRLRNSISDQLNDFSYSLGAGGVMTGSINVITINMNRLIQNAVNNYPCAEDKRIPIILRELRKQVKLVHKYQIATKKLFKNFEKLNMLPAYSANFIDLDKQYVTVGINGLVEGAEFLGYKPGNNEEYKKFISTVVKIISDTNKETCNMYPNLKINTEMVPAENLGVKFAKWDKKDGLFVPRDCYNSYFYVVEDEDTSIIDKFVLHGSDTTLYLDGGSALHANLEDIPSKETFSKLLDIAVRTGCPYFCFNVKVTICNDCKHIDKRTNNHCVKCGSKNVEYATRVIGYLRKVSNFSKERQEEESRRCYNKLE